jgi:hypothetical protein
LPGLQDAGPFAAPKGAGLASSPDASDDPTGGFGVVIHPAPVRSGGAVDAGRPRPGEKTRDAGPTLERTAADALRHGDLKTAIDAYDRLAAEEPGNPAFARTAAILRERQAAAAPAP